MFTPAWAASPRRVMASYPRWAMSSMAAWRIVCSVVLIMGFSFSFSAGTSAKAGYRAGDARRSGLAVAMVHALTACLAVVVIALCQERLCS
ncbi:hypothetical protein D9M70_637760 [compost metagenome]